MLHQLLGCYDCKYNNTHFIGFISNTSQNNSQHNVTLEEEFFVILSVAAKLLRYSELLFYERYFLCQVKKLQMFYKIMVNQLPVSVTTFCHHVAYMFWNFYLKKNCKITNISTTTKQRKNTHSFGILTILEFLFTLIWP
jgi:hypothetical protein